MQPGQDGECDRLARPESAISPHDPKKRTSSRSRASSTTASRRPRPRCSRCCRRSAAGSTSRRASSRSRAEAKEKGTASTRRSASPPRGRGDVPALGARAALRHLARRRGTPTRRRPAGRRCASMAGEALAENPSQRGKAFGLPIVTSAITHGLALVGDLFVAEGDPC